MNIASALKKKNRLVAKLQQNLDILKKHNSLANDAPRRYNLEEVLTDSRELIAEIVSLKTSIHNATQPVRHLIFRLSELKGLLKSVGSINVSEGTQSGSWSGTGATYVVQIDMVRRDNILTEIQNEIDVIQDELDYWNATNQL